MKNKLQLVLILFLGFNALALVLLYFTVGNIKNIDPGPPNIKIDKKDAKIIPSVGEANPLILEGIIRKERIPEELELGEYWFWLYFDEPYLLVNNAAGTPLYIDKIQLVAPENIDFYNMEDYIDKRVDAFGYQTWGYAESSVFQILSLKTI